MVLVQSLTFWYASLNPSCFSVNTAWLMRMFFLSPLTAFPRSSKLLGACLSCPCLRMVVLPWMLFRTPAYGWNCSKSSLTSWIKHRSKHFYRVLYAVLFLSTVKDETKNNNAVPSVRIPVWKVFSLQEGFLRTSDVEQFALGSWSYIRLQWLESDLSCKYGCMWLPMIVRSIRPTYRGWCRLPTYRQTDRPTCLALPAVLKDKGRQDLSYG